MPVERRGWVIAFEIGSTGNGRNPIFNGRRQPSCGGTSRMTRECQVRICERLGVKFPGPTRPNAMWRHVRYAAAFGGSAERKRKWEVLDAIDHRHTLVSPVGERYAKSLRYALTEALQSLFGASPPSTAPEQREIVDHTVGAIQRIAMYIVTPPREQRGSYLKKSLDRNTTGLLVSASSSKNFRAARSSIASRSRTN